MKRSHLVASKLERLFKKIKTFKAWVGQMQDWKLYAVPAHHAN